MIHMKILIAEDDNNLRNALQSLFQKNLFTVDAVSNGEDALAHLLLGNYDAAVLDVMMPKKDGVTVVLELRQHKNFTPVLLLTAKAEVEDRVAGLDAGANDYLPKPFDIRELLARVRVLTRPEEQQNNFLCVGNVRLDTSRFTLFGPAGSCSLVNKEFQILQLLLSRPSRPVSTEYILQTIWDPDSKGQENALWTVIYNLRQKLLHIGADITIRNKRNLGYAVEINE